MDYQEITEDLWKEAEAVMDDKDDDEIWEYLKIPPHSEREAQIKEIVFDELMNAVGACFS